jgi:hypothetical protein
LKLEHWFYFNLKWEVISENDKIYLQSHYQIITVEIYFFFFLSVPTEHQTSTTAQPVKQERHLEITILIIKSKKREGTTKDP